MDLPIAVAADSILGESVAWSPGMGTVIWTDIVGKRLWTLDPKTGTASTRDLTERLTCLATGLGGYDAGNVVLKLPVEPHQPGRD